MQQHRQQDSFPPKNVTLNDIRGKDLNILFVGRLGNWLAIEKDEKKSSTHPKKEHIFNGYESS